VSNTIKIKNSGNVSAIPSYLEHGELGLNYADGKLFYKNSAGTIVEFTPDSGTELTTSDTPPASPSAGDLWYESDTGKTFIYYDSFWVEISGAVGPVGSEGPAGVGIAIGGLEGQILAKTTDTDYDTEWIDNYTGDLRIIVKNDSGVTINKSNVVMAVGAVGDRIEVAKAVADGSISARYMLGLASVNILDGSEGYIQLLGEIRNLDTSSYAIGTVLYIDPNTAGGLTSTEPTSPDLAEAVAIVTRSHASTGIIFVRMWSQGESLDELHNVLITDPQNKDALVYDSSTGLWKNTVASSDPMNDSKFSAIIIMDIGV
jgi:hypothetical protein